MKSSLLVFESKKIDVESICPGDLIVWSDNLHTVVNATEKGALIRDCNTGAGLIVKGGQDISIVKNIQIQK